jgi:hypothetical protein
VRYDSTTGKLVQNSGVTISDANLLTTTDLTVNDDTTLGSSNTDTVNFNARVASDINPATDNTYDLGVTGHEWRNLNIDGTANIDSLVADTADINGGTIDGTTIGATTPSTGAFTTLTASGASTLTGRVTFGEYLTQTNTQTLPAGVTSGNNFQRNFVGDAGGTSDYYSTQFSARLTGANAAANARGMILDAENAGSGTLASASPFLARTLVSSSGSVTNTAIVRSVAALIGAGNITGALAFFSADPAVVTSTGDITGTITGLSIGNIGRAAAAGTFGVNVLNITQGGANLLAGFRSQITAGANKYNLYLDGTAQNYLAGNLGIGTATPTEKLDVTGTVKATAFSGPINGTIGATTPSTGAFTTLADSIGDVRLLPQNSQSTAYTLVLADAGKHILHPSADTTARTFTIPANGSVAYPIGTAITFVNQASAGVMTIAITTDTMRLAGAGTTGSRTLAANGIATCLKLTATEWIISGTGLT